MNYEALKAEQQMKRLIQKALERGMTLEEIYARLGLDAAEENHVHQQR